ncbi:MAG: sulfatase-like hydrolase/transferase [Candidatus Thorarchaeota archaeon]
MTRFKERPNIIIFITHDQGQFLSCYNSPQFPNSLSTPNINILAKNGVQFNNYIYTLPQCSPSRGSLMTGLYPHQNGLLGLVNLDWTLPENIKTLRMCLRENSYSTHLLGLQHESLDVSSLGYDNVGERKKSYHYTNKKMEVKYNEFFEQRVNDENPFFVNRGTIELHPPFVLWSDPVDPKYVNDINDPNEITNFINDPTYIMILTNLRQKKMDWMIKTKDPLLQGRIEDERKKDQKII